MKQIPKSIFLTAKYFIDFEQNIQSIDAVNLLQWENIIIKLKNILDGIIDFVSLSATMFFSTSCS